MKRRTPQPGGVGGGGCAPRTYGRQEGGGGEWGGARLGPTARRRRGGARDRNTPRNYGRRGGGAGVRTIVTHPGPMTGGRTYDRRGCLKKVDKYAPAQHQAGRGQGFEKARQSGLKPDEWPP